MKQTLATLVMLAAFMPAMAQTDWGQITIDGQIRTRGEYRNGQGTLTEANTRPGTYINDRVRLGIGWERGNLSMKFSAQHTGVWGDDATTNNSNGGNININEAWAKLKFADEKASVQLGRQVLSYDDERLLGGLDWATTGRSHDALKFSYKTGIHQFDAFGAYNSNKENSLDNAYYTYNSDTYQYIQNQPAGYQHMEGFWYHANVSPQFAGSFLFLNTALQNNILDGQGNVTTHHTENMQTMGVYLNGKAGRLSYNGSGYYQFGKKGAGVDDEGNPAHKNVCAWMFSANAKYQITDAISVGVGDDYISGGSENAEDCHTFNVLYGTHHKFYGAMDYFNNSTMPSQGLNDLNINANFKVSKKVDISGAFHYFAANHAITIERTINAANVQLFTGRTLTDSQIELLNQYLASSTIPSSYASYIDFICDTKTQKSLGSEVDLQVNWKIMKDVTFQAGYSMMFACQAMEIAKNVAYSADSHPYKSWQDWGWISLNINPCLFTSKKKN